MLVLGISAFYHDSAAALIKDGRVLCACHEERFTRIKHDESFPYNAIKYCITSENIDFAEIDIVVFYEKPLLKFERILENFLLTAPISFPVFVKMMPNWLSTKLYQRSIIKKQLKTIDYGFQKDKLRFSNHHLSHAASAFFPSPYYSSAILTIDGVGEWATCSIGIGEGSELKILKEIEFPNSLGLLYSAFTAFCGFKVNSGEYKLMGLAPYGKPIFVDVIFQEVVKIHKDGSFSLNQKFFNYTTGLSMTSRHFERLFQVPARQPESTLDQIYLDIAASIQIVTERIVLGLAQHARAITGMRNLCLAGGVALNCVANGKLDRERIFENVWIQPASGDAGGSVGAALAYYWANNRHQKRRSSKFWSPYLGPFFRQEETERTLLESSAVYKKYSREELLEVVTDCLESGKAVGWFQGRAEFGPRALGNRSILADPRPKSMQERLNLKTKFRESFRPFAPVCLYEQAQNWFEAPADDPYMLKTAVVSSFTPEEVKQSPSAPLNQKLLTVSSQIPAVTHVDGTARLQTVTSKTNALLHSLLMKFYEKTGCPVLVNTSFNVRGEPMVLTPLDAFKCFMATDIDVLVIGNCVLLKSEQNPSAREEYHQNFELD